MKVIEGFENEDIIVSDFGEWVGKNYIDYKAEYNNNRRIMDTLFKENRLLQQKYNQALELLVDLDTPKCIQEMKENINRKIYFDIQGWDRYIEQELRGEKIE